jgi:ribokinase
VAQQSGIVGSYNVGFFYKGNSHPVMGETIMADEFKESYGGNGSNQAIAAASFGGDVSFLGSAGKDKYGEDALALYDKLGVIESIPSLEEIHSMSQTVEPTVTVL